MGLSNRIVSARQPCVHVDSLLRADVNNSLEGSAAANPVWRVAQLVGLNQFLGQTAMMLLYSPRLWSMWMSL